MRLCDSEFPESFLWGCPNLAWLRPHPEQAVEVDARLPGGGRDQFLVDDLVAEIDALVTDVYPGPGDQLLDLAL